MSLISVPCHHQFSDFQFDFWIPSFFKTITNILVCQLLTNKIDIVKLLGVLGGRKDGFRLDQTSDYDV